MLSPVPEHGYQLSEAARLRDRLSQLKSTGLDIDRELCQMLAGGNPNALDAVSDGHPSVAHRLGDLDHEPR